MKALLVGTLVAHFIECVHHLLGKNQKCSFCLSQLQGHVVYVYEVNTFIVVYMSWADSVILVVLKRKDHLQPC